MSLNTSTISRWAMALSFVVALSGCMATEADTVSDPVVTFPSWSTDHNQTQDVTVVPPAGWTVSRVEYSLDGVNWQQAAPDTAAPNKYIVALTNLDIGDSELMLRVTSTYRDQTSTTLFSSTINVAQQFDCAAASMLPSNTMILQDGTDVRTLTGYFGDPQRGHSVVITISFSDVNNVPWQVEAPIQSYGRTDITASFNVSRATCNRPTANPGFNCTGPCSVNYTLSVLIDGKEMCPTPATNFGVVTNLCVE